MEKQNPVLLGDGNLTDTVEQKASSATEELGVERNETSQAVTEE